MTYNEILNNHPNMQDLFTDMEIFTNRTSRHLPGRFILHNEEICELVDFLSEIEEALLDKEIEDADRKAHA